MTETKFDYKAAVQKLKDQKKTNEKNIALIDYFVDLVKDEIDSFLGTSPNGKDGNYLTRVVVCGYSRFEIMANVDQIREKIADKFHFESKISFGYDDGIGLYFYVELIW